MSHWQLLFFHHTQFAAQQIHTGQLYWMTKLSSPSMRRRLVWQFQTHSPSHLKTSFWNITTSKPLLPHCDNWRSFRTLWCRFPNIVSCNPCCKFAHKHDMIIWRILEYNAGKVDGFFDGKGMNLYWTGRHQGLFLFPSASRNLDCKLNDRQGSICGWQRLYMQCSSFQRQEIPFKKCGIWCN